MMTITKSCERPGCERGWLHLQHPTKPAGVTSHSTPCLCNPRALPVEPYVVMFVEIRNSQTDITAGSVGAKIANL